MKQLIDCIFEYKGHAAHNSEKSLGDPDEIHHFFRQGYIDLHFRENSAFPYIFNKKTNQIRFGKAGTVHPSIFHDMTDDEKEELGIPGLKSVQQLRYCCGLDTDKEAISKWYEENRKYVDNIVCGRIWNDKDLIKEWDENYKDIAEQFDELKHKESAHTYICNWNELNPNEFKEVNDTIVKLFCKKHNRTIKTYIAIDNNGEPVEVEVSGGDVKVTKRTADYKDVIKRVQAIHLASQKEKDAFFRGWKDQLNKDKDDEMQKLGWRDKNRCYAKRNDKFAKHIVKDEKTGKYKVVYGAKIGDSLIDYINNIINEKKTIKNDEGKTVPEKCPDCGGDVKVYIKGEPVYLCSKCQKYFGVVPFKK